MKRTSALLGLALAASLSLPLLTAGPAHATASDCRASLKSQGYLVGPIVTNACDSGAQGSAPKCVGPLVNAGVSVTHAETACKRASAPAKKTPQQPGKKIPQPDKKIPQPSKKGS